MAIDLDEARKLAFDHACEEYRCSITVEPSRLSDRAVYGLDGIGWVIFSVVEKVPSRIGGDECIAVNLNTSETRSLGIIGD